MRRRYANFSSLTEVEDFSLHEDATPSDVSAFHREVVRVRTESAPQDVDIRTTGDADAIVRVGGYVATLHDAVDFARIVLVAVFRVQIHEKC